MPTKTILSICIFFGLLIGLVIFLEEQDSSLSADRSPKVAMAGLPMPRVNQQGMRSIASTSMISGGAEFELPDMQEEDRPYPVQDTHAPMALWQPRIAELDFDSDQEEHVESIKADVRLLNALEVGGALDFFIPQLGHSVQSVIDTTSNQYGDVKVWKGRIEDGDDKSNVIITQGAVKTHVILSTAKSTYSVQIDNKTGQGSIVDDLEYTRNLSDEDDAIPYPHQPDQK